MSEFRLWVHGQIARLDGARERRFVALASALVFAFLAIGPQALRVVDAQVNAPDIRIDELGPNPVSNPVRFKATALNFTPQQIGFVVTMPDGSIMGIPGHRTSTTDPSLWESADFLGVPGQTYSVRGKSPSSTGAPIESSQAVTFTIFDPAATQGTATGNETTDPSGTNTTEPPPDTTTAGTVEIFQLFAWPGTEPKIEARGQHGGFTGSSAFFRVQSITGLAFLGEYEAQPEGANGWHALFAVPGGSTYRVTLIVRPPGVGHESIPREIIVPVAETSTVHTPPPTAPPPPPPPAVSLLLPTAGTEQLSPITLAARVQNATATNVVFEVLDPAGVTRPVQGAPGTGGGWTAVFVGEAGQYAVGVRTKLMDSTVIPPAEFRPFRILAPAATAPDAGTEPVPVENTTATPPVAEPFIELFSPPEPSEPFTGPVPMSARVRNGVPDRVAAIVNGPNGETLVIATKTPTGDFWNAIFEGPDGEYRFRMRALVAGKDIFSAERRFAVKRAVSTTAPPPPPPTNTTTAPPPPPPPPTTTTAPTATTALPPPPRTTTGTTLPPPPTTSATAPQPVPAGTAPVAAALPDALTLECRQAGILPERCADWIKAKYQSRECQDAGALTREACTALLARLNIASDETRLIGLPTRESLSQAREDALGLAGAPVRRDALPVSIAVLLPIERDPSAFVRVIAVANTKEDSSPALLVLDGDGDGLPDDIERRFGTDPAAADTDGDGFSDGMEVKNGYNPAGPGTLGAPVRGVERALIDGLALEEPRGAETLVDASFTIEAEAAAPAEDEDATDVIRLSGVAAPNSVVTIFVYSYLPIVVTTTTDENGNWTYDFGSKLAEGRHEAYVSVNDDTGKLVAASSPLSFFVREAQAVSEEDFLRPDVNVEAATPSLSRWFIYGGIALVALALFLVIAIVRQVRKDPIAGSGDGV